MENKILITYNAENVIDPSNIISMINSILGQYFELYFYGDNSIIPDELFDKCKVCICIGGSGNFTKLLDTSNLDCICFMDHCGIEEFINLAQNKNRTICGFYNFEVIRDVLKNIIYSGYVVHPSCRYVENGLVFYKEGVWFRSIYKQTSLSMLHIKASIEAGYVPNLEYSFDTEFYNVYKLEEVKFVTRPNEWSFNQVKDAFKFILKFNDFLASHGAFLKDPHGFNVTFQNSKPIYLDYGSINGGKDLNDVERLRRIGVDRERLLVENMGLNVNLFMLNKSVINKDFQKKRFNDWYDMPLGDYENRIKLLIEIIDDLQVIEGNCVWHNYKNDVCIKLEDFEKEQNKHPNKYGYILNKYKTYKPKKIVDLGGGTGYFSFMGAACGASAVVLENLHGVIHVGYNVAKENDLTVDFALINLRAMGEENKYMDLNVFDRLRGDFCLGSAIQHHLSTSVSFEKQAEMFSKLTSKHLLIEFIPKTDIHVQHWNMPDWYTEENYIKALENVGFKILEKADCEPFPRIWLFCEKC